MRIHNFRVGEWLRALRPYLCECGHVRSAHHHGRARCSRCACSTPRRATRWSMLTIGYRLGYEAGRMTRGAVSVEIAPSVDPPTIVLPDLSHTMPDRAQRLAELARLETLASAELDDEPEHGPGTGGPW